MVKLESFVDNWKVLKRTTVGSINYYLLVNSKNKSLLKLVKESIDDYDHFSGRIVEFEDYNKEIKRKVLKTVDGKLKYVTVKEPFVHKLYDYAEGNESDMEASFGFDFEYEDVFVGDTKVGRFFVYKEQKKDKKKSKGGE